MIRYFYRNTRLLILTIFLILALGIASFQALPRQEDPTLIARNAVVKTVFPGASAERVEALVTEVLEGEISEIEEVETIESSSRVGFSSVSVTLSDDVFNAAPIWSDLRDRIDQASIDFPEGAGQPELEEFNVRAYTLIPSLQWQGENPNYGILYRYAKELAVQLRSLPDTEEVEIFGAPAEEILVEIDAPELVAVGLSTQELADQIEASDAKVSAGQLRGEQRDLSLEVDTELSTLDQIRQIPIQNTPQGEFTRLGDIARVDRGVREPPTELSYTNGQPAIALGVLMKPGQRIDEFTPIIHQELESFRGTLPSRISLEVIFDQSTYVADRINSLIANLLFAALLVIAMVFVAMGWRSSLIVGMALPLTVCGVLGGMTVMGIAVHQISVTGLIIALGLLIDNAIVVVNDIQSELEDGETPFKAVSKTVNYLKVPLFASTITTVMTFLPIALLPGAAGEFVGSIAITVILALVSSLALSLTVIAAVTGRFLSRLNPNQPRRWWNNGISFPQLGRSYRWSLQQATRKPLLIVALVFIIPLMGFSILGNLDRQFFPDVERDQLHIEVEFSPDGAIAQTQAQAARARDLILQHPQVEEVNWFIGRTGPKFYYNITGMRENQSHYAEGMVQLKDTAELPILVQTLQTELDRAFPNARFLVQQLGQGPPFDAPVEMRIYGPNLEELHGLGSEARQILTQLPNVTYARDDLSEARPQIGFAVDEEQARQAGLSNRAIAQQLEAYLEGSIGGSILEASEELPVRVRLSNTERADLSEIASLDLTPEGEGESPFRPFSALGEFNLTPQLSQIARRNQQRVNVVQGFIQAGVLPATVLENFQTALEENNFELPPGYSYEWGGEQEERDQAVGDLLLYVPLLVIVMITALVLSLNSFRQAAIMGLVAVGAIGMALFSLWLFNSILGFMAIVGIMGLVGVAINDSIVVLSAMNEDQQAKRGDPKAIQNVVIRSTRHVVTTTVTTMMGFVPLLLEGDPFWRPLSIAIAGGILGSSLLALYVVPAMYLLLMHRLPRRLSHRSELRKAVFD